jgi:hypothetical protein
VSTIEARSSDAARNAGAATIDMKLEVVVIPVSDIEGSKGVLHPDRMAAGD